VALDQIFTLAPYGMGVTDRAFSRLLTWNPAWEQITAVVGASDHADLDLLHTHVTPEELSEWLHHISNLRDGQTITHTIGIWPNLSDEEPHHWWRLTATPLNQAGTDGTLLVTLVDVTEEIRLQHQLAEAAHIAGEANRTKTEFLSRVSHELRTPLQGVLGFVQLIQLNPRDPDTPRYLELAVQAGEQMVRLISELQEITRIEEGHVDLSMGAVNLSAVIEDVMMMFETEAAARGITLRTEGLQVPAVLASDRRRVHQILANLVSNAIKYNSEGGELGIRVDLDGPRITVSVSDTGRGLSEDQLTRMFTPFDRLGAETSEVTGHGIGLVVARQLAEALGGRLSVESTLGVGTKFSLHLQSPVPHSVDRPISMLCVDDNFASRAVIEAAFSNWDGLHLRTAGTAEAALALAAIERPDLVLIDIHLPDRNGCDLIPEFRAMMDPGRRLHVALFSADTSDETMARVAASGADHFFPKPLRLNEVIRFVSSTVRD
jgi:signal transduction histidine kinase/CheY-like chemotaxis protein